VEIGRAFADAALRLLRQAGIDPGSVRAIGSHGQTIRHGPRGETPFTLQIGDANVIAERCGITTVADFRRRDMAAGGQGAPLLPALHAALFAQPGRTRVVLNLGGIANITVLPGDPQQSIRGFDTGPANCLMDAWIARHHGVGHDEGGAWAAEGRVDQALLDALLADAYFASPPPKSTGRELFNLDWLAQRLAGDAHEAVDVQATLLELTARSAAQAIRTHASDADDVLVCGGGVHNPLLMAALRRGLAPLPVRSTQELGIDADFVEATAFAWLAKRRLDALPGNLPEVTGARGERVLGAIYFGLPTSTPSS
jgi:anhydro-N-acetylmuramic acid kinase